MKDHWPAPACKALSNLDSSVQMDPPCLSLAFSHASELGALAIGIVKRSGFAHGTFHVRVWRRNGVAYSAPRGAPRARGAATRHGFDLPHLAQDEAMLALNVPRVAAVFAGLGDAIEAGDEQEFTGTAAVIVPFFVNVARVKLAHTSQRIENVDIVPRFALRNADILPDERGKTRRYGRVAIFEVFSGVHHSLWPWRQTGDADRGKGE